MKDTKKNNNLNTLNKHLLLKIKKIIHPTPINKILHKNNVHLNPK
jgi:hypothetical protein